MKKLIGLLAVIFIANVSQVFATATDCTVGAEVKAGTTVIGYAFYCKDDAESQKLLSKSSFEGYFGKTLVGLMAAPQDQGKMAWSKEFSVTGVTATQVGAGLHNTIELVDKIHQDEDFAALSCFNKGYGDASIWQTRWFLPSQDELNLMHKNLFSDGNNKGKFKFIDGWYWSSSEYDYVNAWLQYFVNVIRSVVDQDYDYKGVSDGRVRCAQAF